MSKDTTKPLEVSEAEQEAVRRFAEGDLNNVIVRENMDDLRSLLTREGSITADVFIEPKGTVAEVTVNRITEAS